MPKTIKKLFVFMLIISMIFSFQYAGITVAFSDPEAQEDISYDIQFKDIDGHWAQKYINYWTKKGVINGYQDNTIRPENKISRAEFIALVNRAFGYRHSSSVNFSDISLKDWYYKEFKKANYIGYIKGYEDGTIKPENFISRIEVAVIVARILKIDTTSGSLNILDNFNDKFEVYDWGKGALAVLIDNGYMSGYSDNTIKPNEYITRAETIAILNKVAGEIINTDEVYPSEDNDTSTVNGNLTVTSPGAKIKNVVVKGNLYLTEGIGDGEVALENVIIEGKTIICGGGKNSVVLNNSTLSETIVEKKDGMIRIKATGDTVVGDINIKSGASLEESNLSGKGFGNVYISMKQSLDNKKTLSTVNLDGNFDELEIKSSGAKVNVNTGKIFVIKTGKNTKNIVLNINNSAEVIKLDAKGAINVNGKVHTAEIKASGVVISQKPENVILQNSITVKINGEKVSESHLSTSIPAATPTPTPTLLPTHLKSNQSTATPTPTPTPIPTSSPRATATSMTQWNGLYGTMRLYRESVIDITGIASGADAQVVSDLFKLRISNESIALSGIRVSLRGTIDKTDMENFTLYYSDDTQIGDADDIELGTAANPANYAVEIAFTGLSKVLSSTSVYHYFYIKVDMLEGISNGETLALDITEGRVAGIGVSSQGIITSTGEVMGTQVSIDSSAPTLYGGLVSKDSLYTMDADKNGQIDHVIVRLNKSVSDTSISTGDITVAGFTVTGVKTDTDGMVTTALEDGDSVDSKYLIIRIAESGSSDTHATPAVTIAVNKIKGINGTNFAGFVTQISYDKSGPVLTSAELNKASGKNVLVLTYSEALVITGVTAGSWVSSNSTVGDMTTAGTIAGLGTVSTGNVTVPATKNTVALDSSQKIVTITVAGQSGGYINGSSTTTLSDTFTSVACASVKDASSNEVSVSEKTITVTTSWDLTKPTVSSITFAEDASKINGRVDKATIVFSESIADASITNSDSSFAGKSGIFTTGTANDNTTVFNLTEDLADISTSEGDFIYSGVTTKITDLAGNLLDTATAGTIATADVEETDGAAPVLISVIIADADEPTDGVFTENKQDSIKFVFSEAMATNISLADLQIGLEASANSGVEWTLDLTEIFNQDLVATAADIEPTTTNLTGDTIVITSDGTNTASTTMLITGGTCKVRTKNGQTVIKDAASSPNNAIYVATGVEVE